MLLHLCCAVCAVSVIEQLQSDYPEITLYYCNSCIQPQDEYLKRLHSVRKLTQYYPVRLIEEHYQPDQWLKMVKGLEKEPENGRRCLICYDDRLRRTALKAKELDIKNFTTTLTISPLKKAQIINNLGEQLAKQYDLNFHAADFKKKDGYKKSIELSRKLGLYHQNYCGCIFSIRK